MPPTIEDPRIINRIDKLMLRGVTSHSDIANAFGISEAEAYRLIQKVRSQGKDVSSTKRSDRRNFRVRQFENVANMAAAAFDRSRKDETETTIQKRLCTNCVGQGIKFSEKLQKKQVCPECAGEGSVEVETTKIKGQPGNPAFLKVMKECFVEICRLEGLYPAGVTIKRSVMKAADGLGGEIEAKSEELYFDAPSDAVIRALCSLDELKKYRKEAANTIDVGGDE